MPDTKKADIDDFLAQKRVALIGVSRSAMNFSRMVLRSLVKRGYEVELVNPNAKEIAGRKSWERIQDIDPPVDAALVLTAPETTTHVVWDCIEAGVGRIWLHKGVGTGAASKDAVVLSQRHGRRAIEGVCPMMFLEPNSTIHGLHRLIAKRSSHFPA